MHGGTSGIDGLFQDEHSGAITIERGAGPPTDRDRTDYFGRTTISTLHGRSATGSGHYAGADGLGGPASPRRTKPVKTKRTKSQCSSEPDDSSDDDRKPVKKRTKPVKRQRTKSRSTPASAEDRLHLRLRQEPVARAE
jgi:hypothetical protein